MARTKISEFSATPANNTDIDSINIAEGCAPSGINNAIRELMAQLKDFQTGAVGDSFNGPVGTTTAAAGAFTTLSASSTVSGTGFSTYLASPPAIGGTAAAAGAFTTLTTSSTVTLNGGTANGVGYLNGSKVLTTGSALVFDGANLGVGTGSPAYKLDVAGADGNGIRYSTGSVSALLAVASSTAFIGSGTNHPVAFAVNATEQMRLNSTGLGIGNNNPTAKLDVTGTAAISGAVTLSGGTANGVMYLNASKQITTGSALVFDGTNLGIGTVVPTSGAGVTIGNDASSSATVKLSYTTGQAERGFISMSGSTAEMRVSSGYSGYGGFTTFYTESAEQMRLTSTGLGIGTSSPGAKLQVLAANALNEGGAAAVIRQGGAAGNNGLVVDVTNTVDQYIADFRIGNSSQMRLDSAGNLGLGVTPSAWGVGYKAIQNGVFCLASDGTNNDLTANRFINSGGTSTYIATGFASMLRQDGGTFKFFTAPSGTAGNAISFTQAMTLDASGNLLVGTTSNSSGARLRVYASGTFVMEAERETTSSATQIAFKNPNGIVGTIETNGSLTLYNTTSDYRLKNIAGPVTNSGTFIDKLNPVQGSWKADGSRFIGFLAHELQEASETVVGTGVKDGEEMQSIDYSNAELIANLAAELKSLRARVAQLESK